MLLINPSLHHDFSAITFVPDNQRHHLVHLIPEYMGMVPVMHMAQFMDHHIVNIIVEIIALQFSLACTVVLYYCGSTILQNRILNKNFQQFRLSNRR